MQRQVWKPLHEGDRLEFSVQAWDLAMNSILVTSDSKAGMTRVKEAADKVCRDGKFPVQLRTENRGGSGR